MHEPLVTGMGYVMSICPSCPTQVPLSHNVRAEDIYKAARMAPTDEAIRFFGCFTDGGCDEDMQQYWVSGAPCIAEVLLILAISPRTRLSLILLRRWTTCLRPMPGRPTAAR